jgi:hypothetical protein
MGIFKVKNPETGNWESVKVVKGDPGKSAYEFAKDGGYTGSESDFAAKLAKEFPDRFHTLSINGVTYDGSADVDMTEQINAMITAKLGEITKAEEVAF